MKATDTIGLNISWLHGNYDCSCGKAEINTSLGYVSIEGFFEDGQNFYCQGDQAMFVIEDIHSYWVAGDLTQLEALEKYIHHYSY